MAGLIQPEAKATRITLKIAPVDPDLVILGQEIELAQAIVNLVRNAMQASDGHVELSVDRRDAQAVLTVINRRPDRLASQTGMGVGALVARAIVEAHGGTLNRSTDHDGTVRTTLTLPLATLPLATLPLATLPLAGTIA